MNAIEQIKLGSSVYVPRDLMKENPYIVVKVFNKKNQEFLINTITNEKFDVIKVIACNEDDCKIFTISEDGYVFKINNIKIK